MEHALKTNELTRALVLANCFVNKYTLQCGYAKELECEIEKNCPKMFKNEIRVPNFYIDIIKDKIKKL